MRWALAKCFAVGVVLCLSGRSLAADPPTTRLSSERLRDDVTLLRAALSTVHPGLYRYNSPSELDARFAALEAALANDPTLEQTFLAISQFTATLKCGHTFPNPVNQRKSIIARLVSHRDKVPFYFRWLHAGASGARMIVTKNFSGDPRLDRGAEIASINGTPVNEILAKLMTIARADGSNDAKRVNLLEVGGTERYETFDFYFPLMFPQSSPRMAIALRDANNSTFDVDAISYEARLAERDAALPAGKAVAAGAASDDRPLWNVTRVDHDLAYLKMESWVAYDTKWDWKKFVNDTFDALATDHVGALVIDLRGNEGGSSVGDVILARLIDRPVPADSTERFVRYVKTPPELDKVLDTWDASFKDWTNDAIGPVDLADRQTGLFPSTTAGFYQLRDDDVPAPAAAAGARTHDASVAPAAPDVEAMIVPNGPRFEGKVFVLVDASNSSATFQFDQIVQKLKLATLVGQPTGGNQRGINGGAFFFLRLPYSHIEIDIPIMARFPKRGAKLAPDAGLEPDVRVTPTVDDIHTGTDPEMAAVRELLKK